MRRSLHLSIATAVLLCAATVASGDIREKDFEFSLHGGRQSGDNNENVSSDWAYGLRVGYAITPKIMIELNVDSFDTNREISGWAGDPSVPANQEEFSWVSGTEFLYVGIGLLANFMTESDHGFRPYLSFGLGAVTEKRDDALFCIDLVPTDATECEDVRPNGQLVDPGSGADPNKVDYLSYIEEDDTGTLLTAAGGVRYFMNDWLAVRVEGRYYHHDSFNRNQDAFEGSVGASFVVGRKR